MGNVTGGDCSISGDGDKAVESQSQRLSSVTLSP